MRAGRYRTPLVEIERCAEVPRGEPLFDSLVVLESRRIDESLRSLGGVWKNGRFSFHLQTSYPLTLFGYLGGSLLLEAGYDARRFDREAIARMLRHLATLLEGMASDPGGAVGSLRMLSDTERGAVVSMARTDASSPAPVLVDRALEGQVGRTPDAVAVQSGDHRI